MLRTPTIAAVAVAMLAAPTLAQQNAPPAELAEVVAAYAAKVIASAVFVSGRTVDSVLAEELAPDRPIEAMVAPLLKIDVDREQRSVTCRIGAASATAVAMPLGCTLVRDGAKVEDLRKRGKRVEAAPDDAVPRSEQDKRFLSEEDIRSVTRPSGDEGVEYPPYFLPSEALQRAIDAAFAEPENGPKIRTRAVVVLRGGHLVTERYADGFTREMPLPGWSMTKTIVNALIGIRVMQGKLDLDAPLPVPEWKAEDDPRRAIRLSHLLTMSAGLQWNEDYDDPKSDALRMLFGSSDHAAVFAERPVAKPPGVDFEYASGSTNLTCRVLRTTFASDDEYWAFPREALFEPLGMHSALVETDPSGTFVGSSYGFATARDWARFGLLYMNDGMVGDKRVLPEGWVARSAVPHADSRGRCGMHLWLNADPDGEGPAPQPWPELPADLLRMDGHEGQYVIVFPKAQLVVVRLGCTKNGGFDLRGFLRSVLAACAG